MVNSDIQVSLGVIQEFLKRHNFKQLLATLENETLTGKIAIKNVPTL